MQFSRLKRLIPLMSLIVAGCDNSPTAARVTPIAKASIQVQLDQDHIGHPIIQAMTVVKVAARKYEASVTVRAFGENFTVPATITSDGTNTISAVDEPRLNNGLTAALHRFLLVLRGKYPSYILTESLMDLFDDKLKKDKDAFEDRLGTASEIIETDNYYVGEGCLPHDCSSNAAIWVIDKQTSRAVAAIKETVTEGGDNYVRFYLYGVTAENAPPPLNDWLRIEEQEEKSWSVMQNKSPSRYPFSEMTADLPNPKELPVFELGELVAELLPKEGFQHFTWGTLNIISSLAWLGPQKTSSDGLLERWGAARVKVHGDFAKIRENDELNERYWSIKVSSASGGGPPQLIEIFPPDCQISRCSGGSFKYSDALASPRMKSKLVCRIPASENFGEDVQVYSVIVDTKPQSLVVDSIVHGSAEGHEIEIRPMMDQESLCTARNKN